MITGKVSTANHEIYQHAELDSHENMMVFGIGCYIFDSIDQKTCNVQPFDPSIGVAKNVLIVDAALAYDCPYTYKTYILLARNVLIVKGLENHLIPPFIMREAGLVVNEVAKIHMNDPSSSDHSIIVKDYDLKIPLQLNGVFSYFKTRKPAETEIEFSDKFYITPDSYEWNPYSEHFSNNEESLTDDNGDVIVRSYREKELFQNTDFEYYEVSCNKIITDSFNPQEYNNQLTYSGQDYNKIEQ